MSTVTEAAEPASKVDLGTQSGGSGEIQSFDVTLKVRRYLPETSEESYWDEWTVTMYGTDRVLDALHKVKWEIDGTLSFRRSCAHGICGSDAMRINGRNRLACKTLLKDLDLSKPILVEPIKGLPVEKDLIVDMDPFFQSYREDYPDRDDANFMAHTMIYRDETAEMEGVKGIRFETKPVVVTRYQPMERKY